MPNDSLSCSNRSLGATASPRGSVGLQSVNASAGGGAGARPGARHPRRLGGGVGLCPSRGAAGRPGGHADPPHR